MKRISRLGGRRVSPRGANGLPLLPSYTVTTLPAATTQGSQVYVSNGATNKRVAVSDGTNWRFPDGAVVS